MLNISKNDIRHLVNPSQYSSFVFLEKKGIRWRIIYVLLFFFTLFVILMFLPWTQNINAKGYVTTLRPEQRPQAIQSVISGKLEDWYVKEGDYVKKGDTIVFISEVKPEYFDPNLIERTQEQVAAKEKSVGSYGDKVSALGGQYRALIEARDYKISQTKNKLKQNKLKIEAAKADLKASENDKAIAEKQLERTEVLYSQGIKSLTDLEAKRMKYQNSIAKLISNENSLLTVENEAVNLIIELSAIKSEYDDKLSKSISEKMSAVTSGLDAEATTAKLKNNLANYNKRNDLYFITSPQNGYITKTVTKGIGEIIKEGTDIVTIMPEKIDIAVELYVRPIDIPLLEVNNEIRLQFDGWPAIVFSGWPNSSFGTFTGKIVAIDRFISDNGKYRILAIPNDNAKPWPDLIRVGSGANTFILLNNVFVWYEVWRQLNGFPPDFYKNENNDNQIKRKAPIKSVK